MSHGSRRISYGSSKVMGLRPPMYTNFWTVEVVPPWSPPGYYSLLIPLISFPTCIKTLQIWMSDILFSDLVAVFVARFMAIRFGRVAVERRVPIAVNCLIDPSLILPLVLIVVDLTLHISLNVPIISLKRLLWRSRLPRS